MQKTVLVTGAEGFIGSHLTEYLVRQGYRVRAFVWYNSFNRVGWLDDLPNEIRAEVEVFTGDIRDVRRVEEAVAGQEAVLHLAALIGIPYSYHAPQSYLETNVTGTLNVLEAARRHQTDRVLITSTSEVYGTALSLPMNESHPLQPQSPYSASKIGADSLAMSYYHSFELPVTLVRPFNTFGPRQSQRAIIPTVIAQLLGKTPSLQLGDLRPMRDFCFVKDTAAAFVSILRAPASIGNTLNVATGQAHSMQQVVEALINRIQPGTPITVDPDRIRPKGSEVQRLCGDATRLSQLTGWQPQFDLEAGLAATVDWFQQRPDLWGNGSYVV